MARIFLVEDDVCTQSLLKAILRARSHEVVGIADNEEGAIAGILSTKPELCLIDVHLSGAGTGLDVAEFILEKLGIPVIVMSGDDQPTLPIPFVLKPVKVDNLMVAIDRAWNARSG
jgi:DNA-binding NarL/FixJ family response regulator